MFFLSEGMTGLVSDTLQMERHLGQSFTFLGASNCPSAQGMEKDELPSAIILPGWQM